MRNLLAVGVLFFAGFGITGCGGDSESIGNSSGGGNGAAAGSSGSGSTGGNSHASNSAAMEAAAGVYEWDVAAYLEQTRRDVPAELQEHAARQQEQMAAEMSGSIELNADGTMAWTQRMPMTFDGTHAGTWKLQGTKITLTRTTEDNKTRTQVGELSDDTITLRMSHGSRSQQMVFHRD